MKVIILVRLLWSAGTQRIAIEEAKTLAKMGHDVRLIFLRKSVKGNVYLDSLNDVNYEIMSKQSEFLFSGFYSFISGLFLSSARGEGRVDYNLLRKFPRYIRNYAFDILVCHDQWSGLAGYYTSRKLNKKYVVYLHERAQQKVDLTGLGSFAKILKKILTKISWMYEKKILANAYANFGVTKMVADSFRTKYGIYVKDNQPGINKSEFVDFQNRKDQILCLSYWRDVKHPEEYVPYIKQLKSFNFIFAGSWASVDFRQDFEKLLRDENLDNRVKIQDKITEEEKTRMLRESKFLLRLGFGEFGPGMATFEAMSMGTPVITNGDVGSSSQIRKYSLGVIVDLDNISNIGQIVANMNNEEAYRKYQENIGEFIDAHSWAVHSTKLLEKSYTSSR